MQTRELGRTGIEVSALCLGSMTWGTQNTEAEGHAQIDMALDRGVDFIDTAEMYPVNPLSRETAGRTEEIIGSWLARTGRRDEVVIATKVVGAGYANIRDGGPITGATIRTAIEGSLRRLRTDVIDLYQLHWPNRGSYHFRKYWTFDASGQPRGAMAEHVGDVLETCGALVAEGKIRAVGLSNESAWGTMQFLRVAEAAGLPRVATVQNEYSLLCRIYDLDLAELSHHEDVGLLAFSPLAAGLLSGKYRGDVTPPGSRRSIVSDLGGRITPHVWPALDAYHGVAAKHGIDPVQMALAWCLTRPFMASAIFGATSLAQLANSLDAADLRLADEVLDDIGAVHRAHPKPI